MEFHRGLVRAYDPTTHTAAVLLVGSLSRVILGLPVAHHIGPALMVEGAACGVAFFAEGSQGVVLCTFSGAPAAWVTSALIVDGTIASADILDGTVAPADLSFSPCTPEGSTVTDPNAQTITTTYTTFGALTITVTVPAGRTYRVFIIAHVEMNCTAYTAYNIDLLRVYEGADPVGSIQGFRTNAANDRASVSNSVLRTITATTTFTAKVAKALDRNTEEAARGAMTAIYWEDT